MKNPLGKSRKTDAPYMIFVSGDWEYRVLKTYKTRESELKDPYSRWFLATKSPHTYGQFELGDGYVKDVLSSAKLLFRSPVAEAAGY